jgi:phenylacetate-coenzyme A ligase PaaK-like adenylate-forming protein
MDDLLLKRIFNLDSEEEFNKLALEIFRFQADHNTVYNKYLKLRKVQPYSIHRIEEIPFLPIEFFKNFKLITGDTEAKLIFTSSGTTGENISRHYVMDECLYQRSFTAGFRLEYGDPDQYCILALLPSYLERDGSSLIYMVRSLIEQSKHPDSGFYLNDMKALADKISYLEANKQQTILIGVSFALLDFTELYSFDLQNTIIMETGGMKGRRKEITREELHKVLTSKFGVPTIHSEYGMTELLSQAYSKANGVFTAPPWMKVLIRDVYDPFSYVEPTKTGAINVIDLANIYSCSFIECGDLGISYDDGTFKVLGRLDNSDIRGCNLLLQEF